MSFYILISSHHFILDILFKKFAKNEFLYSIKNNSPYGIKKQKNTSTWDTEVTPPNQKQKSFNTLNFLPQDTSSISCGILVCPEQRHQ